MACRAAWRTPLALAAASLLALLVCASKASAESEAASAFASERPVIAAYYLWYGTPAVDGAWVHWNHSVLPHWRADVRRKFPEGVAFAPEAGELHSPFYPAHGPYSSANGTLVREHFRDMLAAGINVALVSWWGRPEVAATADSQGVNTDARMPEVLAAAADTGMRVALHLEPYPGRSAESVAADVEYLHGAYLGHGSIFRACRERDAPARASEPGGVRLASACAAPRPVLFVYDSYHIGAGDWAPLLRPGGRLRGGALDAVFIGLWTASTHGPQLAQGGFDGAYTYFASDTFVYGSTPRHWGSMNAFLAEHGLAFLPSVGPGYDDRRIRPWNAHHAKAREDGEYYARMWRAATALKPPPAGVGITSWNEWGEGTQIEQAVPAEVPPGPGGLDKATRRALGLGTTYEDYGAAGPGAYLRATAHWAAVLQSGHNPELDSKCPKAAARAAAAAAAAAGQYGPGLAEVGPGGAQ